MIVDAHAAAGRNLEHITAAAIRGGADVIQLRHKGASSSILLEQVKRLLAVTRPAGIPFIINDAVDVAAASGADGAHVGQDDVSIAEARKRLPPGALVGQSTHSLEQALASEAAGADYIGVGPIFTTPTKPDYGSVGLELIRQARKRVSIPFVCIGGIELSNIDEVASAGAGAVAVVRAVCASADPESAARLLKERLGKFHPISRQG